MFLLSIIIPVYNVAQYVNICLDSILQTVSGHMDQVEIILVDDGSTDDSARHCREYAEHYPNIHLYQKKNGGVASARNLGLQKASGKYIAWIDPDDYVSPEWFCCLVDAISKSAPDVIVIDSIRFGLDEEKSEVYGRSGGFVNRDIFFEDVIRDIRMLSGLPNKIMKASLFTDIHFDETLSILEDYAAIPQILRSVKSVYYIPKCLYFYRQHEKSLLHNNSEALAFAAVQTAFNRMRNVEPRFSKAAITATAWQAFQFCRNHYLNESFCATESQLSFCKSFIRKQLWSICTDDIHWKLKVKMSLLALGIYGFFICIRKKLIKNVHGGRK